VKSFDYSKSFLVRFQVYPHNLKSFAEKLLVVINQTKLLLRRDDRLPINLSIALRWLRLYLRVKHVRKKLMCQHIVSISLVMEDHPEQDRVTLLKLFLKHIEVNLGIALHI
jgi:hypothetical protein